MYDLVPPMQEVLKDLCEIFFQRLQVIAFQRLKNESF
jgi:hypothetical protein